MPPRISASSAAVAMPMSSVYTHCRPCQSRTFSSTPAKPRMTQLRRRMFAWLQGPGENLRYPLPGSTNYLSAYDKRGNLLRGAVEQPKRSPFRGVDESEDARALEAAAEAPKLKKETTEDLRPFPLNQYFTSQSILSEELREQIWKRIQVDGKSVRQVSVEMGVDMRRVAAVVRLVELERRMKAEGKALALPYARAIHSMVPVNELDPNSGRPMETHESINDLEQHPLTYPQIFYPTSESRAFNRTDAGRVFSGATRLPDEQDIGQGSTPFEAWQDTKPEIIGRLGKLRPVLKPTDSRIPHPHLIAYEKDKSDPELERRDVQRRYLDRLADEETRRKRANERAAQDEESKKTTVDMGRWQFVVTEVMATRSGTGLNGRGTKSPGFRYGVPSQERKKGQIKIPTEVRV